MTGRTGTALRLAGNDALASDTNGASESDDPSRLHAILRAQGALKRLNNSTEQKKFFDSCLIYSCLTTLISSSVCIPLRMKNNELERVWKTAVVA